MSSICSKCGATTDKVPVINQVCVCGGVTEEIDDNILKALLPFAPAPDPDAKFVKALMGGAVILASLFCVRKR